MSRCHDADPLVDIDLPLPDRRAGKVRVSYRLSDRPSALFVTTDRLSAFDRIIAVVPYKGQVLNQLAAWWFEQTRDIVANHVLSVPDPNVIVARTAHPLPVEVVVRGYITGVTSTSLWQQYADGARTIYGYDLPDGLRKNTALPAAIITPTTKAAGTARTTSRSPARRSSRRAWSTRRVWEQVCDAALRVFALGQRTAAAAGLILADTKYEFGLAIDTGELLLIDEMHTPDSSRYWVADTLRGAPRRRRRTREPRQGGRAPGAARAGYRGDGAPPALPADVSRPRPLATSPPTSASPARPSCPAPNPPHRRIAAAVDQLINGTPTADTSDRSRQVTP